MNITYREMTSNDLELMVQFEKEMRLTEPDVFPVFKEDKYRTDFRKNRIEDYKGNKVILCFDSDMLIGRVDIIIEQSFMDYYKIGYIDWIYVLKGFRKNGIGAKLIEQAERVMKQEGTNEYYLFVAGNEEAQRFYKSIGIEIKSVEKASKKL